MDCFRWHSNTGRAFLGAKEPVSVLLIADQSPDPHNAIWTNFFGKDTPCIHGPEVFSKKLKIPVVFYKYSRVKRGYYTLEIIDVTNGQENLEKGLITKSIMGLLETIIREKPSDWLWSHKRWKHKRQGDKIIRVDNY